MADTFKARGPNLTQSRQKVTVSNAEGRVILPEK